MYASSIKVQKKVMSTAKSFVSDLSTDRMRMCQAGHDPSQA